MNSWVAGQYADTSTLHRSESGVLENNLLAGPVSYAGELARYIRCPSTVRTRTLDRFGYGPSVDVIREMQSKHRATRDEFRLAWEKLGEDDQDGRNFAFFGARSYAPTKLDRAACGPVEPELSKPLPAALPGEVIAEVAKAYKLTPSDITGQSKLPGLVRARNMVAFILHGRGRSKGAVGRIIGGRDHSTIVHACRRFDAKATDAEREFAQRMIGGSA